MEYIKKEYMYNHMEQEKVTSPCISICKTDPLSGFCYGCGRTNEEKNTSTPSTSKPLAVNASVNSVKETGTLRYF